MKLHALRLAAAATSFASIATAAQTPPAAQLATGSTSSVHAASDTRQSFDEPAVTRLLPVSVTVNGHAAGNWVLLEHNGRLFATADSIEEWRLNAVPGWSPMAFRGQTWFPLQSIPGFRYRLNAAEQSIALNFDAHAFAATRLTQDKPVQAELTPAIPAVFANYDLSYTRTAMRGFSSSDLGALTEFGVSGRWGILSSSYVAQGLTGGYGERAVRRLETSYTRDFLGPDVSLRVGDSSTRAASWGQPVFFGGLQLGRNFGLRPGFISQPLPVLRGTSSSPSTVELYINDALRQTSNVPTGPFVIDSFPQLTGSGQARLVVRDLLGRETVLMQDFFSHANLLEEGLFDWSIELGKVRSNIGVKNSDYGQQFGSALGRLGLSKTLTVETRAERGSHTQGAGVGLAVGAPFGMLAQVGAAASRNEMARSGHLWQGALSRTGLQHSFTVDLKSASSAYRQIGQEDPISIYKRQLSASYNFHAGPLGSVGVGYARVDRLRGQGISTSSANYTLPLAQAASLTMSLVHVKDSLASGPSTSVSISLFVPLGGRVLASTNAIFKDRKTDAYVSASRGLDRDTGWGWRALGGYNNEQTHAEGGLYLQTASTLSTADLSVSSRQQTLRLGLQGALVGTDGHIFASRRMAQSFAVVEVPGYANVGVNVFGNTVARTDEQGRALVPHLMAYQENSIRLDPAELPISAELDNIEQITVPASRSAVKVVFPVRSGRGALLKIVLEDGEPAPAGASLELVGDKKEFFVARRGEAFVTGLQPRNTLRLNWKAATCAFDVELPPGKVDEIARLGPLVCKGVNR